MQHEGCLLLLWLLLLGCSSHRGLAIAARIGHSSCGCDGAPSTRQPRWLLGLRDLEQPEQASLAALQEEPPPADSNNSPQLLLKPRTLPPLHQQASLQQAPGAGRVGLAAVARAYGVPAGRLQRIMQRDAQLRVTEQGLLVWSCGSAAHEEEDGEEAATVMALPLSTATPAARRQAKRAAGSTQQQPSPAPDNDAFSLHSRSRGSVQHTIFLDFHGCSISDSYWNAATSKPLLQTQPFDLDGEPAALSEAEMQAVTDIWAAVAQDFAAWAVDVTTEAPGQDALVRDDEADGRYGMHVCIGGSSETTVGGLSGGLAFTGAWGQLGPALQPVLVFPVELGNGHARAVADSISHEVGHTFGLAHFGGVGSAPYNEGEGPWGPLLGQPYARTLSQWSHGLAVSGSVQDDVAAISQSGLPCVADDHGDTPATATPLCEQPQQLGARCSWQADSTAVASAWSSGTIGHGDDVDVFSVQAPQAGEVDVRLVLPSSRSGLGINNLLASVSVSDGQRVLATAQPVTGAETVLEARFRLDAAAGLLVTVAPTSAAPHTSSYGSLGDYELHVAFLATAGSSHLQAVQAPQQESPDVQFGFSSCSTAPMGALVLLSFEAGSPGACRDRSVLAAAPATRLLPACPCLKSPGAQLPVPQPGSGFDAAADGSYDCRDGVYRYAWHAPDVRGCHRLDVSLVGGGRLATQLLVV